MINAVCPDVILCFGTENGFGLASTLTDIPVVIHLQGILNPYYEAWMPQGLSWRKWLWGNKNAILTWLALKEFKEREMKMFRSCKYFIGRTDWDQKSLVCSLHKLNISIVVRCCVLSSIIVIRFGQNR